MIGFIEAYDAATSYFSAQNSNARVACALECPSGWIFYEGDANLVEFGAMGVFIDKDTGERRDFLMPRDIAIFREAVPIDIHSLFSD